jgi:energy-coupling factor transport system permease protein
MALATNDPVVRVLVLVAAWILLARRLVPGRRLRPLAIGVVLLVLVTVAVNGLLSHTGATVMMTLPASLPLLGGPITVEGFVFGMGISLGLAAAVSVCAALSLVTEPTDLADALPSCLARSGAALGAALNLVPSLVASFVEVRDTQRLRGWRVRGARTLVDVVVPVLGGAIESSLQLGEAMEARAFGSRGRSGVATAVGKRSIADLVVGVGALAALSAFVALRVVGAIGVWYPYPTLGIPAYGLAAILPPLVLALVALALSESPR